MFKKLCWFIVIIVATFFFVSGAGALLSAASWVANILGAVLIPLYGYFVIRLVKEIF